MPMPLTPPAIEDESVLARYPFLPQSRAFIRKQLDENGISVEGLIEEPWSVSYTHLTLPTILLV